MKKLESFLYIMLIASLCIISCMEKKDNNTKVLNDECCCPHTTILLQPFDNFSQTSAQILKKS